MLLTRAEVDEGGSGWSGFSGSFCGAVANCGLSTYECVDMHVHVHV